MTIEPPLVLEAPSISPLVQDDFDIEQVLKWFYVDTHGNVRNQIERNGNARKDQIAGRIHYSNAKNPYRKIGIGNKELASQEMAVAYCIQANTIERGDHAGATGKGINEEISFTLNTVDRHAVAYAFSAGNSAKSYGIALTEEASPPLRAGASGTNQVPTFFNQSVIRRLTPIECERLMGFPDNYTQSLSTGQRYRVLGNSMAVPVVRWIGEQIVKALEASE